MAKSTKSLLEQCEKMTIRFSRPQAEKLAQQCQLHGIKPSKYVQIAGVAFADHNYLDLKSMMLQVFDEQIRLRRDFNDAVDEAE